MDGVLIAGCTLLGLLTGSFANVVIYRVPAGESIVSPGSACPVCGHDIRWYDNVPVLSWLFLRGRCRDCNEPFSVRYPLVELATGVLFGLVAWRLGASWLLPGELLFAWTLVVLALIDAATRRIPNRLTYPLAPALLVILAAGALLAGAPESALRALLGGLAAGGALLLLALIAPRGMGMGDVKLAGLIGIGLGVLGWPEVVVGIMGGFVLGGVAGVALLATGLRSRKDMIPFGPYLAAGALLSLLWGAELADAYLSLWGLA
jgi:leader peptidase (prepilin peptidase)/N-methyltransferase